MDGAIVFLAFTASWCGPCAEFKKDFSDVSGIQFIDVSEPENKEIVEAYRVAGTPTIVAVDDAGKEVARTFGYHGRRRMQRWMDGVNATQAAMPEGGR